MWPKSYESIVKALNILKDTSIHHFREGLSFSQIFPKSPIPEKEYIEHIIRILRLYQDHNATAILVFGMPLPHWMNNEGRTPPYVATGWCPMPVEDIHWAYANTQMSQAIASLGETIWNDPRLNKDWLRKQLLIEPFNEFDSLNTYLLKDQSCGGYLPYSQSGKRSAEFSNKVIDLLSKKNIPLSVIMSSGVSGNTDYFKSFYENGGTGPANAHLYPEYSDKVDYSSVAAITDYRNTLSAGLRSINSVIPDSYKNRIILGEFGLVDEKIGVCETQQIGNDGSTYGGRRTLKGTASDRFLTEIFHNEELERITSIRMKWMYVDGGYIDKEDSNDPNKGKATGCNRTNGSLTKDLNPKFQLYNYLLEADKFRWKELPLVSFIEYKAKDPSLKHNTGFGEEDSWSATVNDKPEYMIYGPYVANLPKRTFGAVFDVAVDNNSADNAEVLGVDVYDFTSRETLAARVYTRMEMATPFEIAELSLPFSLDGRENHQIEFRAYTFGVSYVRINRIRVALHSSNANPAPVCNANSPTTSGCAQPANGQSKRTCNSNGTAYGACTIACNTGFEVKNDQCVAVPITIEYKGNSSKLFHRIGRAEQDAWSVTVNDGIGHMIYGPYVTDLPRNAARVVFEVVVDNNSADNAPLVTLEVFDFTSNQFLAQRQYGRREMAAPFQVGRFEFPISMAGHENHQIEFRVLAHGISYIKINRILVLAP
jgi:hypothetical protein